jgi:hypothetical protein
MCGRFWSRHSRSIFSIVAITNVGFSDLKNPFGFEGGTVFVTNAGRAST